MPKINMDKIKALVWALPPINEQALIVGFVSEQVERIDAMIAACRRSIDLAREKRQALVTGQLDVGATTP